MHKRPVSFFLASSLVIFFTSCHDYEKNSSHGSTPDASIREGKTLAAKYCASCHLLPDPSLLDSKSWENGVLPQMGPRLGIFYYGSRQYPSYVNDLNVGKNFYPAEPVISFDDWQHLIDYYAATSPDSLLPKSSPARIDYSSTMFQPQSPALRLNAPATSFIKITSQQIVVCDVVAKKLFRFNGSLNLIDSCDTRTAVTDVIIDSNQYTLCNTGVLNPNNGKFGLVGLINLAEQVSDTIIDKLMRPVQVSRADLDHDGKDDYLVCEFGNLSGALSWLQNTDTGYVRHVIRPFPGAIKTYIDDYNHDGLPDIWALFAQGEESVFLFTNKGNGQLQQKEILRFPPSYGSSSFELDDFNKDGFPDIVYTCGDNADYSVILKPYHGVYIFINDGKNNFTQKYFFPINGCYKAIARDFDNDGDLDIATIAFFPDYVRRPEEGFVYLKNEGNFQFKPYTVNAAKNGRWLTMDAGDVDGDGKIDLVLGNFAVAPAMIRSTVDWKKQPQFLLLRNIQ
ncbi:MAG TPA: VCBS repeat-containing protein [Parafilimonas sp.]|nr:VCBS repeat-containing protein [Parafilimonas sp.]